MNVDTHLLLAVLAVLGLVVLDWLLGAAAAARAHAFDLRVLDRQLASTGLPYFTPLLALFGAQAVSAASLGDFIPQSLGGLVYAACVACAQRLVQDVVAKTQALLGGATAAPAPSPPAAAPASQP